MRLPFDFNKPNLEENARIKFLYNSPELHQNIEISIDGNETSVETLLDAFERFLGALGIHIPNNVVVGFIELEKGEDGEDEEDSTVEFELEKDEEDEEDK